MLSSLRTLHLRRGARIAVATFAFALCAAAAPIARADDAGANLDIVLFEFAPRLLDVPAGTSVTWLNHDSVVHSVTHGTAEAPGELFDSGLFDQDQSYTFAFDEPGEYAYFCARHSFMQGTITVT